MPRNIQFPGIYTIPFIARAVMHHAKFYAHSSHSIGSVALALILNVKHNLINALTSTVYEFHFDSFIHIT